MEVADRLSRGLLSLISPQRPVGLRSHPGGDEVPGKPRIVKERVDLPSTSTPRGGGHQYEGSLATATEVVALLSREDMNPGTGEIKHSTGSFQDRRDRSDRHFRVMKEARHMQLRPC